MISLCEMHAQTHSPFKAPFNFYKLHVTVYLNNGFNLRRENLKKKNLQVGAKALQDSCRN